MPCSNESLAASPLPSPLGPMLAVFDAQDRLCALDWEDHATRLFYLLRRQCGVGQGQVAASVREVPVAIRRPLARYFDGDLHALDAIVIHCGGTEFQRSVWAALRRIAPGTTTFYGALAAQIGRPRAVRATGAANGANPVSIVVPCHRVIGADGRLTGYGGGLDRKRWLLDHESAWRVAASS